MRVTPLVGRGESNIRAAAGSAVHEVAAFQSESFHGRLRKPAPRLDLFIRSHHGSDDGLGRLGILLGDEIDRADGRTTLQWFGCHQYDLTICHVLPHEGGADRPSNWCSTGATRSRPAASTPA